jgi:hypothetical protein
MLRNLRMTTYLQKRQKVKFKTVISMSVMYYFLTDCEAFLQYIPEI